MQEEEAPLLWNDQKILIKGISTDSATGRKYGICSATLLLEEMMDVVYNSTETTCRRGGRLDWGNAGGCAQLHLGPSEPEATRVLSMTRWEANGTQEEHLYCMHDAMKNVTSLFGEAARGRRALYEYRPNAEVWSRQATWRKRTNSASLANTWTTNWGWLLQLPAISIRLTAGGSAAIPSRKKAAGICSRLLKNNGIVLMIRKENYKPILLGAWWILLVFYNSPAYNPSLHPLLILPYVRM